MRTFFGIGISDRSSECELSSGSVSATVVASANFLWDCNPSGTLGGQKCVSRIAAARVGSVSRIAATT